MKDDSGRIEIIDGFRCLAVLSVIFFHYYYRFAPPLQEPGYYDYEPIRFFKWGNFGVQFFFIISGFVISQSLESCKSFVVFLKKRFFRLLPTLVLCSILTYLVVEFMDQEKEFANLHSTTSLNFLFSFTLLHPDFWNFLFSRSDVTFIDGVYWSLWVEVFFYISAGFIFFFADQSRFLRNWLVVAIALQFLRIVTSPHLAPLVGSNVVVEATYKLFFFLGFNQWIDFSVGIFFFSLYKKRKIQLTDYGILLFLILLELFFLKAIVLKLLLVFVLLLFLVFIRKPNVLSVLKSKIILSVGLISYPFYLLHENIGIIFIDKITGLINWPVVNGLIPLMVIFLVGVLSYLIHYLYENPLIGFLKARFLNPNSRVD